MEIKPDFSQEVRPPKPGTYRARIEGVEQKFGKQSGAAFLNWKLRVRTPSGDFTVFHRTMMSGKGAGFLKQFIQAAYDPNYEGGSIDTDKMIHRTLTVDTREEINNQSGQKTGYLEVGGVSRDTVTSPFEVDESPNFNDTPF